MTRDRGSDIVEGSPSPPVPTVPKPHPEPFDPCRAWLGIDRAELSDPLKVLGLPAGETDPLRVLRAAETRLARLKGLAAGEHHAAREALILRVEQARESVLSRIAKAGGKAPAPSFSMPPPPRQVRADAEDAHVDFDSDDDADQGMTPTPIVRVRSPRLVRKRGTAGLWVSLLTILASLGICGAFIWWQGQRDSLRQAARAAAKAAEAEREMQAAAEDGPAVKGEAAARPAKPLPEDALVSSSPPPTRPSPVATRRDARPRSDEAASGPMTTATADEPSPEDPPALAMNDTPDDAGMAGEPSKDDDMATADEPAMDDTTAATFDPAMDDTAPADDGATGDASETDGAVREALAAVRAGDFDSADAVLASALADAVSLAAKRRVSDWQVLAQYARDFAGYREKALAEVKTGNEFDVNGKVLAVVEIDEKKFVYRWQGRNRTSPRDKIPAGITFAIVSRWFDARPANQLYLGAWHATKPEPDAAKARECWARAEKGGLNAEPLLRLLDDPALAGGDAAADDAER
mgnify:CR=1 FL=1